MMFSEMVAGLARGLLPDEGLLRRRFDMAMTKKMGIIRLPPPFWPRDPKINPRADHLFWASLLLLDRQRIDLALAVLAAEQAERLRSSSLDGEGLAGEARELRQRLFAQIGDERLRQAFRRKLGRAVPEWLPEEAPGAEKLREEHGH
jgi:hypothetical protein